MNEAWTTAPALDAVGRRLWADGDPTLVLLVDGLGAGVLERFAAAMPRLSAAWSAAGSPLARSCFPSTTAACLPTLGRGAPPGEHGFVGYGFRVTGAGEPPIVVHPTHRADDAPALALGDSRDCPAGPRAFVAAGPLGSSFLTREAFPRATPSRLRGRLPGEGLARVVAERRTALFYLDAVDAAAHRHGLGSGRHLRALRSADRVFGEFADLAEEFALVVLADHGMVAVDSWIRLEDFVSARDLAGVAGEARAAHLYAHPGHEEGLLRDCRRIPGAIALSRAEAVAAGLFGPDPSPPARERLGDVVVTFDAPGPGLVWAGGPGERRAPAQHGGLSEAELLVPLLRVGGSG